MNGLDLIRATLAEWRRNRGNETTFYKCQHFDGWYVQWALQGFRDDSSIRVYSTAQIAADASPMFTRRINDKAIQAGDRLYFRYGVPGHIVTAVGWDGDRLLVSNTAGGGDTVIALSNNVKIHHADTIDLTFIGASRQNGSNRGIRVNNYIHGAGSPAGSTPSQEDDLDAYERSMLEHIYFSMTPGIEGKKFNGDGYNKILDAAGHAQVARESAQRIEKVVVGDFDRQGGVMKGKTNLSSVIAWFDQNMIVIRQLVESSAADTAKRITAELVKVPGVDPKVVQDAVAKAVAGTALDPNAIAKSVADDLARRLQS